MAVVEAMKRADSIDPAKFASQIFNVAFKGATGPVQFDSRGDRKDAEMTIFRMQGGRIVPIALVKAPRSRRSGSAR